MESCEINWDDVIADLCNELIKSLTERGFNCCIKTFPKDSQYNRSKHDTYHIMDTGPNKNWDNVNMVRLSVNNENNDIWLYKSYETQQIPLHTPYDDIVEQIVNWWIEKGPYPYSWMDKGVVNEN